MATHLDTLHDGTHEERMMTDAMELDGSDMDDDNEE